MLSLYAYSAFLTVRLPWVVKGVVWVTEAALRTGDVSLSVLLKVPGSWKGSPTLFEMKRVKLSLALLHWFTCTLLVRPHSSRSFPKVQLRIKSC